MRGAWLILALVLGVQGTAARGDDLREEARAHYQLGKAAFNREQYREALAEFDKSFQLAPLPELLFNMARCHELLHEPEAAARDFDRFLAVNPTYGERAELEAHVAELREQARAAPPPPAAVAPAPTVIVAPPPPARPDRGRRRRALAIGLGVAGGVVVGAIAIGVAIATAHVEPYHGNLSPGSQPINP